MAPPLTMPIALHWKSNHWVLIAVLSRTNVKVGSYGDNHKHCVCFTGPSFGSSDTWFNHPSTLLWWSIAATGLLAFPPMHPSQSCLRSFVLAVSCLNNAHVSIHLTALSPTPSLCSNISLSTLHWNPCIAQSTFSLCACVFVCAPMCVHAYTQARGSQRPMMGVFLKCASSILKKITILRFPTVRTCLWGSVCRSQAKSWARLVF